jgi:hypothetical protein
MVDMRMLMIVLTAVASVLVTRWAEAGHVGDPGLGFIQHKNKDVVKDQSVKGSIVTGGFDNKPVGVVGDAPYASSTSSRLFYPSDDAQPRNHDPAQAPKLL